MSLRVIEWPDFLECANPRESAMTVGVFDGVHLGHRELIERTVRRGPNPTVITFRENPKKAVSPAAYEGDIFTLKQKLAAFERLGASRVVLIDFSEKISTIKGREFIDLLGGRGRMAFLAIGRNFRCGYRQDTGAEAIKELNERKGIPTELVPPVEAGAAPVSSSRIRRAILSGDIALAAALTGRAIELDLSDLRPLGAESVKAGGNIHKGAAYDLRSARRIVPDSGHYSVSLRPGGERCRMYAEAGKVFLPREAESLEFAIEQTPGAAD